jgi:hypothetical protein
MRRVAATVSIVAVLSVLAAGSGLHVHRVPAAAAVHWHFETPDHHGETSQIASDDHATATYLDPFCGVVQASFEHVVAPREFTFVAVPPVISYVALAISPTAHAPPALSSALLRAPPA